MNQPSSQAILIFVLSVLIFQPPVTTEDIIWYQGSSDLRTGHYYGWRGTTDGTPPEVFFINYVNQPWLVAVDKQRQIFYWTDNEGIVGAWSAESGIRILYQFNIGRWSESSGPALSGIDFDELANQLYITFNQSIYRLDLRGPEPTQVLIGNYDNLVFNPRYFASQNLLIFCKRNKFKEQGDLVQVSLLDPERVTILVANTSTGSIVQQMFIVEHENNNTLYYNSPGTLTMVGVSLMPPYPQVYKSMYLSLNPTMFDYSLSLDAFVFGDLSFSGVYYMPRGSDTKPTKIYTNPNSFGKTYGVKFINDTHILVVYSERGYTPVAMLTIVNINNMTDTTTLNHNYGMGTSLIFDSKYCNFYYAANPKNNSVQYLDQLILRKNIKEDFVTVYQKEHMQGSNTLSAISLDVAKRNLVTARSIGDRIYVINYFPLDNPNADPIAIVDSQGRSLSTYTIHERTGDVFFLQYENYGYDIYRLIASSISKDWINNVGQLIVSNIGRSFGKIVVDAVNDKLYYFNTTESTVIFQCNLDGSNRRYVAQLNRTYSIQSGKWDPTSNRLYILAALTTGWYMVSLNSDGSNMVYTSLNMSTGSARDLFKDISPDPTSDWVYMNAEYYQPLRIKKDGSVVELLYWYIPYPSLTTIAFDERSGTVYYGDTQNIIKKIDINKINKNDPAATPFEVVWQGDKQNYDLSDFILDKYTQAFWILQVRSQYPVYNYTLSVTPIAGGPTRMLFQLPKDTYPPWALDTPKGILYAYTYKLRFAQQQEPALVQMNLINGSDLVILKAFKYPNYSQVSLSALARDPNTGILYYTLEGFDTKDGTILESYNPFTKNSIQLWKFPVRLSVRDMVLNDTSLIIAPYADQMYTYDIRSKTVKYHNASATLITVDPVSDMIYLASGSIFVANINDINRTMTTLLSTLVIKNIAFDFSNKIAYYTLDNRSGRTPTAPPYYYVSALDGRNKKKLQIGNAFDVPTDISQFSLVNGKFYAMTSSNLDTFNLDGSGYSRIIQGTYIGGTNMMYDDESQRVYWQEDYGSRFYSCAVYSTKYADCMGYNLYPGMMVFKPQMTDFVIGNNGMVYMIAYYERAIYTMDLKIGQPSFKKWINDTLLYTGSSIVMDAAKQNLFVATVNTYQTSPTILHITLNGQINVLYNNISTPSGGLLLTDLSPCK